MFTDRAHTGLIGACNLFTLGQNVIQHGLLLLGFGKLRRGLAYGSGIVLIYLVHVPGHAEGRKQLRPLLSDSLGHLLGGLG